MKELHKHINFPRNLKICHEQLKTVLG